MKGPFDYFILLFLCLVPWHLQATFPKPGGVWKMTVNVPPHFLSHIHVDMAKPCTQKNMCKNNNRKGLSSNCIWWKCHTQSSLQFILITPGQQAFSDSHSDQIAEICCRLMSPTSSFSKLLRCALDVVPVFLWTAGKFHSHANGSNEHKILLPESSCQ